MPPTPFCREALANGSCSQEGCTYRHDVRRCKTCDKILRLYHWKDHVRSHVTVGQSQRGGAGVGHSVRCEPCGIYVASRTAYDNHKSSPRHQEALARLLAGANLNSAIQSGPANGVDHSTPSGYVRCKTCNEDVTEAYWPTHVKYKRHLKRLRAAERSDAVRYAGKNKFGISVTGSIFEGTDEIGVDFGLIDTNSPSKFGIITQTIEISKDVLGGAGNIAVQQPIRLSHIANMELCFHNVKEKKNFTIVRTLKAIVGVADDHESLKPTAPFDGLKPLPPPPPPEEIHPGRVPVRGSDQYWERRQNEFRPRDDILTTAFDSGAPLRKVMDKIRDNYMPKVFNKFTHGEWFRIFLYIEEEQNSRDLARFRRDGVRFQLAGPSFKLEIEGLAEKRPSVIVGDTILAQLQASPGSQWYQGVVHNVQSNILMLRFHQDFESEFINGMLFNIRFTLNRTPYWRYHQAISGGPGFPIERLLFPNTYRFPQNENRISFTDLDLYDGKINSNPQQKAAVHGICSQGPGSGPFVIWGPPGTGKTVTMVETIRQLLRSPLCRILACAPSNAAADLLATRLGLEPNVLFRLYSVSRDVKVLPPKLLDNVLINSEGSFAVPPLEELEKYHVIVSTCVTAGVLKGVGLRRGHFSYIFIDEAGQAHEPETLIPITAFADKYTNVVLSGDPKQLPPMIRSPLALKLGLEKSYLERMFDLWKKQKKKSGVTVFMLQYHFRSHPDIIAFPNNEFYEGKLQNHADPTITESLRKFSKLKKPDFHIMFHAVSGKDDREGRSPSFFNIEEASLVNVYVEALLGRENQKLRLSHDDIGVISPYQAQCSKILRTFKKNPKMSGIKVGSVEEFQGQERRVIIVSTVRSSVKFIDYDLKHDLGFVADPRRFNVAVTRAQALLIIIGNPLVLSLDHLWRKFLNYVYLGGGWIGKRIDWDPNEMVDLEAYDVDRNILAGTAIAELVQRAKTKIVRRLHGKDILCDEDDDGDEEGGGNRLDEGYLDRAWRDMD
ncbi:P-loop containing nucleoside triphosphate hydrolase protein [Rickenella mellea]|uniref:RNA helicase n=1 Tax=Rickenella mellea TaxID=50990 RepID=A0A4Y7QAP9_9AGAM|nr:P-loop containing nucleoside triphosphate hydrolase protein [Rickenella mellea]